MAIPTTLLPSVLYGRAKITFEELHYLLMNMKKKAYTPLLQVGKLDTVSQDLKGTPKSEVLYAGPRDDIKGAAGGYDVLVSSVSIKSLASGFEALQLVGSAKVGIGNAGHNNIIGNKYHNRLDGKSGNDWWWPGPVTTGSMAATETTCCSATPATISCLAGPAATG
jgi:hypothetical protein